MLQLLVLSGWLLEASLSQITGYGNQTAVYGGDVLYGCAVANLTGVLQVTWERHFKDDPAQSLATYSRRFGLQVNPSLMGRVVLTEASLSSTSIRLTNVTWEDEGCYVCSFNAYPEGSKRRQTCLTVQGISERRTAVSTCGGGGGGGGDEEVVVISCTATGKPAPTIRWISSPGAHLTSPQFSTATNKDDTFTSSGNVTLRGPGGWTGRVDCLLNEGVLGQSRESIPIALDAGIGMKEEEEEGKRPRPRAWPVVISVAGAGLLTTCIVGFLVVKRGRLKDTL